MSLAPRLLGFAFAAADALIELDREGVIRLALGAGPGADEQAASWTGRNIRDLVAPEDAPSLGSALLRLSPAARSEPLPLMVRCGSGRFRPATLRAFALPDIAPALSCALTYDGPETNRPVTTPGKDACEPDAFLAHVRASLSGEAAHALQRLALAFIDISGLDDVDASTLARVRARLGATLQGASHDGASAGRLTEERYALVRAAEDGRDLAAEMAEAGRMEGVRLTARASEAPLGADAAAALRAMRFAIEDCLKDGGLHTPELTFADSLSRTLKDADRFRAVVRDRAFDLFYQPIVDLRTRTVRHFEALSRLGSGTGPAAAIRMAEELALIEGFDLAVAEKALRRLRSPGGGLLKIAVNVSGASLSGDAYVAALLRMTANAPEDRRRLMIEVTETAALADLAAADRRLSALREAGIRICIDDFGSGSASFDYLRSLSVDAVKIDGGLIRAIDQDSRGRTLIAHLVELCGSLKLDTIAEMIETEQEADVLRDLGVTCGQGWLFGKAEPEPRTVLAPPTARARRQGVVEGWS